MAAIIPYSIPLWTIFTKWPAPFGPQCRYPSVAVPSGRVRPGVGAAIPAPGAIVLKTGSSRATGSSSPPIIRQKPRSSPNTPPDVPTST